MPISIDHNRLQQFGSLEFLARQVVEGFITGLHKSPFHGFSVEFAEHRQYNTGEAIKHIDWKLFARTDRLYVKRYEEETNLRCQMVIDNSSSMYYPVIDKPHIDHPNKITFSIYATAALMYMLRKQRDAVGLSVFSNELEQHVKPKSTTVHHKYLYSILEQMLEPIGTDVQKPTFATDILHQIADNIHKRSLVILFSDMFESNKKTEDLFQALQHLKHNKHEVILFHVVDKQHEIDFNFKNRPYKFVDMETGEEMKVNPSDVKKDYIKAVSEFGQELKMRCAQYHIDFVEADINNGFEQILLPYLVKRNKLH
ncbi:MAG: DUF58 domain-containing protein [Bacteroidales bacterium]|nr:DUF58 domain-containing protein [Bacteroidales bacterium]